jgi:AraC family transcriptional regulator
MFLNLAEPHSVPSLSKKAAMSEPHFYAVYKKLFGVSPAKDLSAARIERAKVLLLEGKSVSAVATEVGFSSEYQFIRSFSKAVGLTPGAYKKQY